MKVDEDSPVERPVISDLTSNGNQMCLELYKALVEESRTCREKVTVVWLQKFGLLGAIIAFLVTNFQIIHGSPALAATAIFALPAVAVLLDVKSAEYALHAKVVDDYIRRQFTTPKAVGEWESVKWNVGLKGDSMLVGLRSFATVVVTVIPTCLIVILARLAIQQIEQPDLKLGWRDTSPLTWVFCAVYITLASLASRLLFRPTGAQK